MKNLISLILITFLLVFGTALIFGCSGGGDTPYTDELVIDEPSVKPIRIELAELFVTFYQPVLALDLDYCNTSMFDVEDYAEETGRFVTIAQPNSIYINSTIFNNTSETIDLVLSLIIEDVSFVGEQLISHYEISIRPYSSWYASQLLEIGRAHV